MKHDKPIWDNNIIALAPFSLNFLDSCSIFVLYGKNDILFHVCLLPTLKKGLSTPTLNVKPITPILIISLLFNLISYIWDCSWLSPKAPLDLLDDISLILFIK